ncbi:septum site-determining protein MinD [Candidatus Blochmanniella vafra str. BVAF]|uniref:Septum site-determining protein MinD n=1 Tax=Blochmanniella vafra (strain BVAF) TaxID=859654 RepID=E8Q706_BLOVB|nr:septum site-determining protein MinD [Candidatus Blochmannia vafer]ADV33830.1 septum site-determining protein MinD [Candidatus Blochmannia vafer str. BVAF]
MTRIIVITSGKGGVGKTTSSAAIATGLAMYGHKTVVIDFDIGLRNLDLIMGCERRVVYDFINVIQGEATLNQALIKDKHTHTNCLYILPASQTRDKSALTRIGIENIFNHLINKMNFDFIICDSPAGIDSGALMALYFADEAIIVTNPEISSVHDSDRILGILSSKSKRAENSSENIKEHLLLTRYSPNKVKQGNMLNLTDVIDILRIPLLGVIPEDSLVLKASNQGTPIILDNLSYAGQAYLDTTNRLLGKSCPLRFIKEKKQGFLKRFFKKR